MTSRQLGYGVRNLHSSTSLDYQKNNCKNNREQRPSARNRCTTRVQTLVGRNCRVCTCTSHANESDVGWAGPADLFSTATLYSSVNSIEQHSKPPHTRDVTCTVLSELGNRGRDARRCHRARSQARVASWPPCVCHARKIATAGSRYRCLYCSCRLPVSSPGIRGRSSCCGGGGCCCCCCGGGCSCDPDENADLDLFGLQKSWAGSSTTGSQVLAGWSAATWRAMARSRRYRWSAVPTKI